MNTLQQARLSWLFVGLLAILCAVLVLIQNQWTAEVSRAEHEHLRAALQDSLNRLSRDFNNEITNACAALLATTSDVETLGPEAAYAIHYAHWKESHDRIFSRIALVQPIGGTLDFKLLDLNANRFATADWPAGWNGMRELLLSRINGPVPTSSEKSDSVLIDMPRFGSSDRGYREREWLVAELDLDYVRSTMLPEMLQGHLGAEGRLDYAAEVLTADSGKLIYQSIADAKSRIAHPDASVALMEVNYGRIIRRDAGTPASWPPAWGDAPVGRWRLLVRHRAGSLEKIAERARWRNLGISAGILLLIVTTVAALVRFSRQAAQLADLQMNFVASVSHELRTPLAVIRTAAFNLRGKMAARSEQVERYGKLIQEESEKLSSMVEQVLQFASTKAGHVIRRKEPVAIEGLIDAGLRATRVVMAGSSLVVEKQIEEGLPPVLADEAALKHVLQNLVDNAVKYGAEGGNWIGISAAAVTDAAGSAVEIKVADRGPGIPADEQPHIFDPFFRGRRAVQDQVHGTGLGLNLVKKIVEAHGGTIRVHSEPMHGTEFVVRIPAAPPELQDEFAHTAG
jgi:signal transduction histidine kinase